MENRPYQERFINSIIKEISTKNNACAQLPTGGGKTVCFSLIAKEYLDNQNELLSNRNGMPNFSSHQEDKSVIILVHREELMEQATHKIKELLRIDPCLITSKTNQYYHCRVYIGMVESTLSRLNHIKSIGLVIIDECHIANFNKVHDKFPESKIIGFSATPIASSKLNPLNKYFQNIIVGPQIKELIAEKYLAQNITRCPKDIVDAKKFKIIKGDFDERQMAVEYRKTKYIQNVIINFGKFCRGTKTVVFNVNIDHSKDVTECFKCCGYNARHLDSNCSSEERKEILNWFKNTPDAILCNVMIATVGFDVPTIRNVILNFSTLSIVKFIQCCGRGSRVLPEKKYFNIIDMGGNCMRLGDWNEDKNWKDLFDNPESQGDGIAPLKICPQCEGLVAVSVRICPLNKGNSNDECLYDFDKKMTANEKDLELVVITKGINVEELVEDDKKNTVSIKHSKEMKWKIKNSSILDQDGILIATLPEDSKDENERAIAMAPEALDAIKQFVERVNSGKFHPKTEVKNFEKILERYRS